MPRLVASLSVDAALYPTISVVIPSYNRREGMLALLSDVFSQKYPKFEVIVVDDCSSDGSAEAIAADFPRAKLLCNAVNSGPCVARNLGISEARGEIIVGFDSDVTLPDGQLLDRIQKAFETTPNASGFAFRILIPGTDADDVLRWWHPVSVAKFGREKFETSYFSGTGYAFRTAEVVAAGMFPEVLYMHYEEVVLALRLMDKGGTLIYRPDLCVTHHANPTSKRSEVSRFYKPRNQILIALLAFPPFRAVTFALPRMLLNLLKAVGRAETAHFIRALSSALKLAPSCLAARQPIHSQTWQRVKRIRRGPTLGGAH